MVKRWSVRLELVRVREKDGGREGETLLLRG
jgi:hypothetical protein